MMTLGIVLTFLVGIAVLLLISSRFGLLEFLGLSFPIGIGVQTFIMFLLNFFGISFSINLILTLSAILVVGLITLVIVKRGFNIQAILKAINPKEYIGFNLIWVGVLGLLVYILYIITAKSLFWPTFASDSLSSFDVLAKGIAGEGNIINSILMEKRVGFGAAYPPLYTMALAYSYMLGFELSKIIPALFFVSLAIGFYALVRKLIPSTFALLITLLAVATPELLAQSAINITSVPQAIYAALGIMALVIWKKTEQPAYFYLSGILIALNAFIRSEGILYIGAAFVFLFLLSYRKKNYKDLIRYAIMVLPAFVIWQIFLKIHGDVMSQYVQVGFTLMPNTEHTSEILSITNTTIFSTQFYGISVYIFLVMVAINIKNIIQKKDSIGILLMICISFFGYLFLLNQMVLKADSMANIVKFSGKRFFFGHILLMWFYIASNSLTVKASEKVEKWLSFIQK